MRAEYSVCLFVSNDLHETFRVVVRLRPAVCRHWKLSDFILHVLYTTTTTTTAIKTAVTSKIKH